MLRPPVVAILLLASALSAWAQTPAPAASVLKLSTAQGPAYPLGKAGEHWATLVTARAAGAMVVKQYPGAALAQRDPGRELLALKDGAADLAVGSALAWSAQVPALAVYALPWLAPEARDLDALAADVTLRDRITDALARAGVAVVAIAPLGERVLATIKAPVRTPAEIAGLRVRASAEPLVRESFAALGARAEAMPFADAQAAFAAGRLEGQLALPTTLSATRIGAAGQRFVTRWGAFSDVMVFAVRRSVWDTWTEEQRALVRGAAAEAVRNADALAHEEAALADLTRQGVTLVRLSTPQRAAFRAAVQSVWTHWTPVIGADVVAAAEAAVAPR